MATDATVPNAAATSPATEKANPFASGKLTKALSDAWTAGKDPEQPHRAESETTATPDPSKETKPEGTEPESAPESGTGKEVKQETKEQKESKESRRKPGAEERISQLVAESKAKDAELERLRAQIAGTIKETKQADTSTAKTGEQAQPLEAPKKPKLDDFKTYEEFEAASDKYFEDLADFKAKKAVAEDRQLRAQQETQRHLRSVLSDAEQRHPGFKAEDTVKALFSGQDIHDSIRQRITVSPVLGDLLWAIGETPDNLQNFLDTAKSDPRAAYEKVVLLENFIAQEVAAASKKSANKEEVKEAKQDPPAKEKTTEPPIQPNREVGNRGTGPSDSAADAVRRAGGKLTKEVSDAWARKYAQRT